MLIQQPIVDRCKDQGRQLIYGKAIVVRRSVELCVFGGSQDTDLDEQFASMVLCYYLACCSVCEHRTLTQEVPKVTRVCIEH